MLGRNTVLNVVEIKLNTFEAMDIIIEYHNDGTTPGKPKRIVVERSADGNYKVKYEDTIGRNAAITTSAAILDATKIARDKLEGREGLCS